MLMHRFHINPKKYRLYFSSLNGTRLYNKALMGYFLDALSVSMPQSRPRKPLS